VTNYHPPPVAATSRFENMARKQPRCAVGPPCGRRVPGQLHLDRFITHLPQCPLSWYTHPTYTLLPPAPSSLPWFRRVIGLGITNCLPRREHVPPLYATNLIFRDGSPIYQPKRLCGDMSAGLVAAAAGGHVWNVCTVTERRNTSEGSRAHVHPARNNASASQKACAPL
jgi:hypothetical protein